MTQLDLEELILSVGDFPANHSHSHHLQEKAQKMIAFSGEKCLKLHKKSGQIGLLERMLMVLSVWDSTKFYHSWKITTTPQGFLIFQLRRQAQTILGKDCGSFPTPTAHLGQEGGFPAEWKRNNCLTTSILSLEGLHSQRGKIKAEFVEQVMGYPEGWTQLDESD